MDADDLDGIRRIIANNTTVIRRLNDDLRIHRQGGVIVITAGIAGLGPSAVNQIFRALAAFNGFNEENDPEGEHDCATVTVGGIEVLWKIDYYNKRRQYGSQDPADPNVTVRVMTVMRADEY